jgi:hypothetical protein
MPAFWSMALALGVSALAPAFTEGSLAARLALEVGQGKSVAILPGAEGLLAIAADGARQRVLVTGTVDWALVDDRSFLVWFGQAGALWMLDLDAATPKPERVAQNPGDDPVVIAYGAEHTEQLRLSVTEYAAHPLLDLTQAPPELRVEPGLYTSNGEGEAAASAKRPAHIAWEKGMQERVQRLTARARGGKLFVPALAATGKVPGVPAQRCETAELCGTADPLGATHFWSVVVEHSCGDACQVTKQLYDGARHEFVDARHPERHAAAPLKNGSDLSLSDVWVAPLGEGFISEGLLYTFDQGLSAGTDEYPGGGWLGNQWYVQ